MMKTSIFFSKAVFSLLFILFSVFSFGQNVGDFRSAPGGGNWNEASTWQVYDGDEWVSTVSYPNNGSYPGAPGAVNPANTVTISQGTTVTVNTAASYTIGDLNVNGTLNLMANLTLLNVNGATPLKTVTINNGKIVFYATVKLYLPADTKLILNIEDTVNQGLHPVNNNNACNNHTAVYIGGVKYTVCKGQGNASSGDTFEDLNNGSAALRALFIVTPDSGLICKGETVSFTGNYSFSSSSTSLPTTGLNYSLALLVAPTGVTAPTILKSDNLLPQNVGYETVPYTVAGDYLFRFIVEAGKYKGSKEIWIAVDKLTTYSASGWDNGIPTVDKRMNAVIAEDYNTGDKGSFFGCNCTVNSGKSLTIDALTNVTVKEKLTNDGTITVESDGNFIQQTDGIINVNNGQFTSKRNTNSTLKRLDYVMWSSPVAGQNMLQFSPLTVQSRFYHYEEKSDLFLTVPNVGGTNFTPGKGYGIRVPNNYTTTENQQFLGVFKGVPNNGIITFPLSYTPVTGTSPSTHVVPGYNLVGNPYPSDISFDKVYNKNSSLIENSAWFWTNNYETPQEQQGTNYPGNNYVAYTATGSSTPGFNGNIKVGQGFMVKAKSTGDLEFNNTMRSSSSNSFFNKVSVVKDRYWLQLTTPTGNYNTLLIGHIEGATDEKDNGFDAEVIGDSQNEFYSFIDNIPFKVQGRKYPLNIDDRIKLGASFSNAGKYEIILAEKEGVFAKGNEIILKDNETGILTDLGKGSYSFYADKGVSSDRFEILYKNVVVSSLNADKSSSFVVAKLGEDYIVKTSSKKPVTIELYDASGKLLLSGKSDNGSYQIPGAKLVKGFYIVRLNSEEGSESKTLIK